MDHSQHNHANHQSNTRDSLGVSYTCPMHPKIISDKPSACPKCGMRLVKTDRKTENNTHAGHAMSDASEMGFWEKFKMSMSMTMGMDHSGLAGREMARFMEVDIRNKFFLRSYLRYQSYFIRRLARSFLESIFHRRYLSHGFFLF